MRNNRNVYWPAPSSSKLPPTYSQVTNKDPIQSASPATVPSNVQILELNFGCSPTAQKNKIRPSENAFSKEMFLDASNRFQNKRASALRIKNRPAKPPSIRESILFRKLLILISRLSAHSRNPRTIFLAVAPIPLGGSADSTTAVSFCKSFIPRPLELLSDSDSNSLPSSFTSLESLSAPVAIGADPALVARSDPDSFPLSTLLLSLVVNAIFHY